MRHLTALAMIALCSIPAATNAKVALPRMSKAELANYLPDGGKLEVRLDTDINGDGLIDVIAIGASDEKRIIRVMLGYIGETDLGYRPVGEGQLDISPLGKALLSVSNGVLIVEDLTGGTTAVQSIYRYRYEKVADRMRLIGDDVMQYSRTEQHGAIKVSTNHLTGRRLITKSRPAPSSSAAALIPGQPTAKTVARSPIYMEEAPSTDDTLESVQ